ncbi:MAG: DUF1957 domain-containing protein [Elusimicrobiales bacterium]|nr:DUF1957 domain-containing protein [Elusimicrobiales bacterium]MCK5106436.1 DUF1957 domain-containing protein [Elusimicrobiales bacterium]
MKGSLMLMLHAHLPYVNHPGTTDFAEESWLFEAVVETYVPIISMIENLAKDGIRPCITISISPTLGAMLENKLLEKKLNDYINSRLELISKETHSANNNPLLLKTLKVYEELYSLAAKTMRRYHGNLITPFKQFQQAGLIEIITSSATHAVLPLLSHPEALRAQIAVASDDYQDRFNKKSRGFWMPECAYDKRLDTYIKLAGFDYTFMEAHAVKKSRYGVYAPLKTQKGLNIFARDISSSKEVWNSKYGYPGDSSYREFYRDLGYDADYEYIKPYTGMGKGRKPLGIKYHRVTGDVDLAQKALYDPDLAKATVARHAEDFLNKRLKQMDDIYSDSSIKPIIVGCYDAELFGHWWFEGPAFVEAIIRRIREERLPLQFVMPGEYIDSCQEPESIEPEISSWGENGYFDPWINESNDKIYPDIIATTERMIETAGRFKNQRINNVTVRALNQAARETLLSQNSDWPFLMYINSHCDYAFSRINNHCENANKLLTQIIEKNIEEVFLAELENRNNIFTRIDFRVFSPASKF